MLPLQCAFTLKHETKEWLDSFQKVHECKSYNEVIELLLQQHPETPIQLKVAQVQRDISPVMGPVVPPNFQRDNKDSALQMVYVAGLVGECAVSVRKIPLVLAYASLVFFGKIKWDFIIQETTASGLLSNAFEHDGAILVPEGASSMTV